MPAPLVAAATYFGLPRLLGGLADKAMQARADDLMARGINPNTDTLINALSFVPRQSGIESTLNALQNLQYIRDLPLSDSSPQIQENPMGYSITRELPYGQGVEFNTPMDDFLKYGSREDDSGMTFPELFGQDLDINQSYGQTSEPATEVRFDQPYAEGPVEFARGGIADLMRLRYAKR